MQQGDEVDILETRRRSNLEHHYQSMVWEGANALDAYLQIVDWLQGANNVGAFFVKGMGDICTG
jgi:hypothetical protein